MDNKIEFYEEIAARVMPLNGPSDLFKKTRRREVVVARNWCMEFRHTELKLSLAAAGARYGKDHATVLHSMKRNSELLDNPKDIYYDRYKEFSEQINKVLNRAKKRKVDAEKYNALHEEIQHLGFHSFLHNISMTCVNFAMQLYKYMDGNDGPSGEKEINILATEAIIAATKIKDLFEYEDSGDLDLQGRE